MKGRRLLSVLTVLAVVLFAGFLKNASGTEWVQAYEAKIESEEETYFDAENVRRLSDEIFKVWIKRFPNIEDATTQKYVYDLSLFEIDCKNRLVRLIQVNRHGKDGSVRSGTDKNQPWHDIAPESTGEQLSNNICVYKTYLENKRNWKLYDVDSGHSYYYDENNINYPSSNTIRIWLKWKLSEESKTNFAKNIKSSVAYKSATEYQKRILDTQALRQNYIVYLLNVDCGSNKIHQLRIIDFDSEDYGYSAINYEPEEKEYNVNAVVTEKIKNTACSLIKEKQKKEIRKRNSRK